MKTFSFLFPQTFSFSQIYNVCLACCPPFSLPEALRHQTKNYNLGPCLRFRTYCNTAFCSIKLILHDDKNHMQKDLLVLCISSIEEMTLNIKKYLVEKFQRGTVTYVSKNAILLLVLSKISRKTLKE